MFIYELIRVNFSEELIIQMLRIIIFTVYNSHKYYVNKYIC